MRVSSLILTIAVIASMADTAYKGGSASWLMVFSGWGIVLAYDALSFFKDRK